MVRLGSSRLFNKVLAIDSVDYHQQETIFYRSRIQSMAKRPEIIVKDFDIRLILDIWSKQGGCFLPNLNQPFPAVYVQINSEQLKALRVANCRSPGLITRTMDGKSLQITELHFNPRLHASNTT
jgi:hypothetical protein